MSTNSKRGPPDMRPQEQEQASVRTMLRSGSKPPSVSFGELDVLNNEARQLEQRIADLETSLREAQAQLLKVAERQSLAAPIRALPREILLHIFELFRRLFYAPGMPFELGHVCKYWRSLSRASPSLWNNIELRILYWNPEYVQGVISALQSSLFLSKSLPLHLNLCLPCAISQNGVRLHEDELDELAEFTREIFEMLSAHISRWKSLELEGSATVLAAFFRVMGRCHLVPNLERLKILSCSDPENSEPLFSPLDRIPFSFGTRLTKLESNIGIPTDRHHIGGNPFRRDLLTSYKGSFADQRNCYEFLSVASNLVTVVVEHLGYGGRSDLFEPKLIVCPLVRHLTLSTCANAKFWGYISMPSLEALVLDLDLDWDYLNRPHNSDCAGQHHESEYLHAFLSHFKDSFPAIHIMGEMALQLPTILGAFHPSLATLKLSLDPREQWLGSETFRILTLSDSAFLPDLVELEIKTAGGADIFYDPKLLDMLASRCGKGLKRLKLARSDSISDMPRDGYLWSALYVFLQRISGEGVDVEWTIEGDNILEQGKSWTESIQ